ncbi:MULTISPECIES: PfkB family carbohydrate kinase [Bacteria]|uniref:PfkB family carbohydrate kinase n=1 Tax=Bacteria TaxID=2 RepID=UPI003C7DB877
MPQTVGVVGEALVDIVVGGETHPGGSPMNVAVGLARLGLSTVLHSRIGSDAHGAAIRAHLMRSGARIGPQTDVSGPSWTATATVDGEGKARYSFDLPGDIEVPELADLALVHTGSFAAVREPGSSALLAALRAAPASTLRSFDPNVRPDVMGAAETARERVREIAGECHVVKLSDEDAEWLVPGASPEDVLRMFADLGARFVVMTRGERGCLALADGTVVSRPALAIPLVDTIGAGDAFMSGLLAGLLREGADRVLVEGGQLGPERIRAALSSALASATIAVSRAGANPPTSAELDAALDVVHLAEAGYGSGDAG